MNIIDQAGSDLRETSSHKRFSVMDGLRGIAALAVVLLHSFEGGGWVPNGRLAVDLFFILSGFVIAYSYEPKLKRSLRASEFLKNRFVRLYPMVFLGALGGVAFAVIHNFTNPNDVHSLTSIAASGGLSILVLPYLGSEFGDPAFSFNPPLWSLFFEVIANIIYVYSWRRLGTKSLVFIIISGIAGIAFFGPLGGGTKDTILAGLPRVLAGFFGGVLLFRLWSAGRLPSIRGSVYVNGVIMIGIFCFPLEIGGLGYVPTFVVMWLVVLAAANASAARSDRVSEFLGDVSYPVYLIHWLSLYAFTFAGKKMGLIGDAYTIVVVAHLIAIPFIGFIVGHFYEKPVRNWLRDRFFTRPQLSRKPISIPGL